MVLDTNVVVSALLWCGMPYRLLQRAVEGDVELFPSPVLAAEFGEVLARPHLATKLLEQGTTANAVVALYLEFARVVSPLFVTCVVPDDPDDDHLIACALAAQANAIVSGDKHLLNLHVYQGMHIVTAAQALTMMDS
ncbi:MULTISPECIES: putative toxin-antitoxin system toxin component, PIN family [unclassified Undibacterium]|uniref:putative toxin-antitoxin system toxin component, PIN family n=1 Tax=unclassified Undibacterium TaxID=2630295 RepID=UPI002AC8D8D8|nr:MULTISPECIES: putative toxin-antitoxin system toxin component, PIN family [unclassified Undibacterium]MEB0140140.1 putative toxin-antitoxin system toxin component, PIN family [Undibacterium sp. CCC2.1]MEB0173592.1 putative toxin-antitoxin system toxin component, PIN family [Undibacterium sp. CCC1.1]MEB0177552.1 putative toxin-antitoxin system toxin component, PIN family [Undibacterium sp. CCC3.4]MEB0214445.1 putative toxin-antitoxin system toxin component, PIN family [Undibacterium sp. 5I2]